jgi:hypothetical protein
MCFSTAPGRSGFQPAEGCTLSGVLQSELGLGVGIAADLSEAVRVDA